MVTKRGRPLSSDTLDPEILRRRQLQRERTQRHRERQRAWQASNRPVSTVAQQQSQTIAEHSEILTHPTTTVTQLGLRLENVIIAQDPTNNPREEDTVGIAHHDDIYIEAESTRPPPPQTPTTFVQPINLPPTRLDIRSFFSPSSQVTPHSGSGSQSTQDAQRNVVYRRTPETPSLRPTLQPTGDHGGPSRVSGQEQEELDIAAAIAVSLQDFEAREQQIEWGEEEIDPSDVSVLEHKGTSSGQTDGGMIEDNLQNINSDEVSSVSTAQIPLIPDRVTPSLQTTDSSPSSHVAPSIDSNHELPDDNESSDTIHSESIDDGGGGGGGETALQFVVDKLYSQLQDHGFHGCSEEAHSAAERRHNRSGDNHYTLDELWDTTGFPSAIANDKRFTTEDLADMSQGDPRVWESLFCGTLPGQLYPKQACLHKEETRQVEPQVASDIDSFLGFASSLDFARQGIWYQPVPIVTQNVKTNVHIDLLVTEEQDGEDATPGTVRTPLRDIPHFFLGRIEGANDVTIHILFPHLVPVQTKQNFLSEAQLKRWVDHIFNPAIHRYCEAHVLQHLPASHRHAYAESRAAQVEGRLVEGQGYQSQRAITYFLQPEVLHNIWVDVVEKTESEGYRDFREPQLYFSAKGTKLRFKTTPDRPTLLDTLENFDSYLNLIINMDYVYQDRLYVDIGKEICARTSLLRNQAIHVDEQAQVYLWKRCCLDSYLQWLYDNDPPKSGHSFFHVSMLRDACNLVSQPSHTSRLHQGGLIYSQFYGSVKETIDANKVYPFQNEGLEELALDPRIRQTVDRIAGGRRRTFYTIEAAYLASKRRLKYALRDSEQKSFGIREEHRVSWRVFQALIQRLRQEEKESLLLLLDDVPSYVWALKTKTYLRFLRQNADRFATGFELVAARAHVDFFTWEQTKMMAMFLRCLRFSLAGHDLARESALWWSERVRNINDGETATLRRWYGLGFSNTIQRYGYCWMEPRIDWANLVFNPNVTDNVLFGNSMLKRQYLRNGGQVQDFFSTTRRLDLALDWLQRFQNNRVVRNKLITFIVHLCLQQLRIDTIDKLPDVLPDQKEEARQGLEPFTYEYIKEIIGCEPYPVSGNRASNPSPSKTASDLFGFNDGNERPRWANMKFRTVYYRAKTVIRARFESNEPEIVRTFGRRFWRWLFAYHWLLPYPGGDGWANNSKRTQERMWYSIRPIDDITSASDLASLEPKDWMWAQKDWYIGESPELPRELRWSRDEWDEYLANQQP